MSPEGDLSDGIHPPRKTSARPVPGFGPANSTAHDEGLFHGRLTRPGFVAVSPDFAGRAPRLRRRSCRKGPHPVRPPARRPAMLIRRSRYPCRSRRRRETVAPGVPLQAIGRSSAEDSREIRVQHDLRPSRFGPCRRGFDQVGFACVPAWPQPEGDPLNRGATGETASGRTSQIGLTKSARTWLSPYVGDKSDLDAPAGWDGLSPGSGWGRLALWGRPALWGRFGAGLRFGASGSLRTRAPCGRPCPEFLLRSAAS